MPKKKKQNSFPVVFGAKFNGISNEKIIPHVFLPFDENGALCANARARATLCMMAIFPERRYAHRA